jgi:hypothetical protein
LDNNIEVFVKLSDIVKDKHYIHFHGSESEYYKYFLTFIFSFGNLEMMQFVQSKIDLSKLSSKHFEYLAFRLDDNVEIVDAVLGKSRKDVNVPYTKIASLAMEMNNINIYKYIHNFTQKTPFRLQERKLTWTKCNIEFLDFFFVEIFTLGRRYR